MQVPNKTQNSLVRITIFSSLESCLYRRDIPVELRVIITAYMHDQFEDFSNMR